MGIRTTITCDSCKKDITTTGATPAYRIMVNSEKMPHNGALVHAVVVMPPTGKMSFCSLKCLQKWANNA